MSSPGPMRPLLLPMALATLLLAVVACDDSGASAAVGGGDSGDAGGGVDRGRDIGENPDASSDDGAEVSDDAGGDAGSGEGVDVTLTPVGDPTWELVGFVQFSAPLGTPDSGYAEGQRMFRTLLPDVHRFTGGFLGPGDAHDPPYGDEVVEAAAAAGFASVSQLSQDQFTAPNGVYLIGVLVPAAGAPTGSSPDFASGPILPNALFPIETEGFLVRAEPAAGSPTGGALPAAEGVDGHSHLIVFFADNSFSFPGDDSSGSYTWDLTILDATGAGFRLAAAFSVE